MDEKKYLKITLNGFLLNAGVVGLIKLLKYADEYDAGAEEGIDYIIDGQNLYVSMDLLQKLDLADLYVRALVYYLKNSTDYMRLLKTQDYVLNLYESSAEDKEGAKKVSNIFSELAKMLEKPSFVSGYEILSSYEDVISPTPKMVSEFKKEKDLHRKKELYFELIRILEQPKVREVLIFKELMYSKINLFWERVSFFNPNNTKLDMTECYREFFVKPLTVMLESNKAGKKRCIDCNELVAETIPISFMNDTVDDIVRKKSYYWKCNPDAFLCPLCAFVYSLVPLGFSYLGSDAVFVNDNSDIRSLLAMNAILEENLTAEDTPNAWYKLYNIFTSEKIRQLRHRANNIQVVLRDKVTANYRLSTVDKRLVEILDDCFAQLKFIQTKTVKAGEKYINVYQRTVENTINRRNQYGLITELFRAALDEGGATEHIFQILLIEIKSKGGNLMNENIKRAYAAKFYGEELRNLMAGDALEKDRDNRLRGFTYQLLNSVSLGNRDNFLNLLIRTYSGYGKPVPDIFLNCFQSDEDFKEIGYAYLLGLKSDGYKNKEV